MAHEIDSVQAIDSLVANEFTVTIDDEPVAGIFSVAGLVTFKLEDKTTTSLKKLQEPFKITKKICRCSNFVAKFTVVANNSMAVLQSLLHKN